jgi:hypothetical protein
MTLNKNDKNLIKQNKNKYLDSIKSQNNIHLNSRLANFNYNKNNNNFEKTLVKENVIMNMDEIKKISDGSKKNEILFEDFLKIKNYEKKKLIEDDNVFNFYNSLSIVMLSMLGGGVLGVIFILLFSLKNSNSIKIIYKNSNKNDN